VDDSVWPKALEYCVAHRAMLLVDPKVAWGASPDPKKAVTDALTGLGINLTNSRNAALFFPRVLESDPQREGQIDTFVPCGIVAGVSSLPASGLTVAQLVAERDRAGHRDLEADDAGLAGRGAPGAIARVEIAAVAVVAQRALLGLLLDPDLGEPVLGAEAAICLAALDQDARVGAVDLAPLALAVRGMGPAYIGTFIPRQSDPVERVEDQLLGVGARPGLIGVLDAQHELASLLAREDVVEQRDVRGADVGIAGRRWCDPHTHRFAGGRHGASL